MRDALNITLTSKRLTGLQYKIMTTYSLPKGASVLSVKEALAKDTLLLTTIIEVDKSGDFSVPDVIQDLHASWMKSVSYVVQLDT